jgi:hypothetical protein
VNFRVRFLLLFCLYCVPFLLIPSSGAEAGAKKGNYLSQEIIDTSIQRGFLLLNESADMAGVGFKHQRSIVEAKKIAKRLKERARGDPNERYILWKVGELEAQIYLEESDLVLQQMRKRQLTINELVDKYNIEVGKWRPDFATLYRIHKSMSQVDQGKANELADSYNQRKRAISREAVYFLEKALVDGDFKKAQKELGYCLRNRLYLDVSQSTYKRLEDRVEGMLTAQHDKPVIEEKCRSANRLLNRLNITEARKTLDSAQNRFFIIRKHLPQREAITLGAKKKRVDNRLDAIEDSLVEVNLRILRSKGVEAADKYLQNVVRRYGVSRQKAADVDRKIISVRSPENNAMHAEFSALSNDDQDQPAVLDDIMSRAKKKAKKKMDSLQAIENARLWKEHQEQQRRDSIEQVARAAREAQRRRKEMRADSITLYIYAQLEKNNMNAVNRMMKLERSFLKMFLRSEEFDILTNTIEQFAHVPNMQESRVTYLQPVATQATPQQSTPPPASEKKKRTLQDNLEKAQKEIVGIYAMLEKNEIDRAYHRFQTIRKPLRKYLAPEAFSMLELSVKQAYEYYSSAK